MLKFRCTHCGNRLAVVERHLSRLAQCPECDGLTNPMAEQILARQKQQQKKKRPGCDNCGHRFGKLQKPRHWGEASVCAPCYRELALETAERDQAERITGATESRASVTVMDGPRQTRLAPAALLASFRQPRLIEHSPSLPNPSHVTPVLDLRAAIKTAGMGLLLTAAAIIVVLYVVRTVGYLLVWSLFAALAGVALYGGWRLLAMARRSVRLPQDEPAPLARTLPTQLLTGSYRLCSAAGSSLWRAARRSSAT